LLEHSNLHLRTIQLVVALLNEKTASARQFGAQHVVTLLRVMRSTRSKTALDSSGGTEVLAAAIGKGLVDANPQVRETSRVAFWEFEKVWPERAAAVAAGLDASGRKLLDKAKPVLQQPTSHAEPASAAAATGSVTSPVRAATSAERATHPSPTTASTSSPLQTRSNGASKKPSVREAMMAARKKMLADKENGVPPPRSQTGGFLEVGDESPLPPPVPAVPESPSSPSMAGRPPQLETPTRRRSPPLPRQTFSSTGTMSPRACDAQSSSSAAEATVSSPSVHHDHVPESIVDDALRDQARQAELAAERLLELSLEEAEDADQRVFSPGTALSPTGATPRTDRIAAQTTPGVAEAFSTPLPNPALKRFARAGGGGSNLVAFEDSPDPRDATGAAAGRGGWWTRQRAGTPPLSSNPLGAQSEPEVTVSDEQRAGLAKLVADLCRTDRPAGDSSDLRQLSELSRKLPMRDDAAGAIGSVSDPFAGLEDNVAESQQPSVWFWRGDRAFNKIYDRLEALLLRPEGDLVRVFATLHVRVWYRKLNFASRTPDRARARCRSPPLARPCRKSVPLLRRGRSEPL
jgi:CLIP-associating protein 1/2